MVGHQGREVDCGRERWRGLGRQAGFSGWWGSNRRRNGKMRAAPSTSKARDVGGQG